MCSASGHVRFGPEATSNATKMDCPLWVKSGHVQCIRPCPLWSRSDIKCDKNGLSALGQKRTLADVFVHRFPVDERTYAARRVEPALVAAGLSSASATPTR